MITQAVLKTMKGNVRKLGKQQSLKKSICV